MDIVEMMTIRARLTTVTDQPWNHLNPPLYLIYGFIFVASLDITTTWIALYQLNGPFYEANPVGQLSLTYLGPVGLVVPYLLGMLTCAGFALLHPWSHLTFRALISLYLSYATYITSHNAYLILTYLS